jgi:hypothetical protein
MENVRAVTSCSLLAGRIMKKRVQRTGLTLVELLIVITIVAALLGLLIPAILHALESARRMSCQSNLRQLSFAVREGYLVNAPEPTPTSAGGWSVALLPALEDSSLAKELKMNPSLIPGIMSPMVKRRPIIYTCRSAPEVQSTIETVPAAHYVKFQGGFADAPYGFQEPWAVGPTLPYGFWTSNAYRGPHAGGFNVAYNHGEEGGSVQFVAGQGP